MNRSVIGWSAAALLGLAATAGVTWAASQLAGQRIALSDQPTTFVTGLAPTAGAPPAHGRAHRKHARPVVTVTTTTVLPTTTVSPVRTATAPTVTTPTPATTPTSPQATTTVSRSTPKPSHEDGQQRDD